MDIPSKPATDADLVDRTRSGDRSAFGCLYDRHARMVRAVVAGAARGPADVDDLSQESFLRAFRKLDELQNPERFRTWLFGIAKNVARERRRSLLRDRHETDREDVVLAAEVEPPGDNEVSRIVLTEMESLPEEESLALRLFFLDERDAGHTARTLGLSRSGVYAVLKRATRKLAASLTQRLRDGAGQQEKQ